jgi:outer membrane protein assembly factor BamB
MRATLGVFALVCACSDGGGAPDAGALVDAGPSAVDAGAPLLDVGPTGFSPGWETPLPQPTYSSVRLLPTAVGQEFVLGFGKELGMGGALGVSIADGDPNWQVSIGQELFNSALSVDLNGDAVPDRVIGGRNGGLLAIDGAQGENLWVFSPAGHQAASNGLFNFYSSLALEDVDGDDLPDVLVTNGGDSRSSPGQIRPPGHVLVLSGATGRIIHRLVSPDGNEIYCSPTLWDRGAGGVDLVFGTGGETLPGSLWRVPLADVRAGDLGAAEAILGPVVDKGYVAPPSYVDLDRDGVLDIVVNSFDARVVAVSGADLHTLWQFDFGNFETQTSPAIGFFDDDDVPDVLSTANKGTFPLWEFGEVAVLSGATGAPIWRHQLADYFLFLPSPLAADIDGDGDDEALLIFANSFDEGSPIIPGHGVVAHPDEQRFDHVFPLAGSAIGTGWVGDADGDGYLEWVLPVHKGHTGTMLRMDTSFRAPAKISWGAYMGTHYDSTWLEHPR